MALFAGHLGELALAYNRVSSIISGPLLGIFLLAALVRRATAWGSLLGGLTGILAVVLVSSFTDWSFFWHGPVGVVATVFPGISSASGWRLRRFATCGDWSTETGSPSPSHGFSPQGQLAHDPHLRSRSHAAAARVSSAAGCDPRPR